METTLQAIITKWGNDPSFKDNYIFPLLTPGISEEQIVKDVQQVNKQIRKYIRRVAARVGIKANISMQHARHTFATILVNSNVPLTTISERLIHGNITTTYKYIGRNSNSEEFEVSELLIPK